MWQQASVWSLHKGFQLCGLGMGGDELPGGCWGVPRGTVKAFTSSGPASPAPDQMRLHYTLPTAYSMLPDQITHNTLTWLGTHPVEIAPPFPQEWG